MPGAAVSAAYDARAAEYVQNLGSVDQMTAQDQTTIQQWRDRVGGRFLDAGCGPGHWSDVLSHGGRREVLAVDGSARFVESAQHRFPRPTFVLGDLAELPIGSGTVGGILAWYSVIHSMPADVPAILGEFARVLAPHGSLLLGFFDGQAGSAFDHTVTTAYYWSSDALATLLLPLGFVIERTEARAGPRPGRDHGHLVATLSR